MQVVILAGGLGTRLRSVTGGGLPKPLVAVNGRPLIDYQLAHVAQAGVKDVIILAGYGADQIKTFCGDGSKWGLNLLTIVESSAAGTAGAVLKAFDYLQPRFLVLYGDTVFDFDIGRMLDFHEKYSPSATLFLHPNDHPYDSDLVEVDDQNRILKFHPYPHLFDANLPNLVNAGVYIIERDILKNLEGLPAKPDFGKHVFSFLLEKNGYLMGYRSPEYIKDAGTPERLKKVSHDLLSGRVTESSMLNPVPAVFIDRDGTLIEERGYIRQPSEVSLIPGVGRSLAKINGCNYRTVLITNQPVIARGECDEAGLKQVHNRLETLLGAEGAYLDAMYCCPHHPDAGFAGERSDLKIVCECRKPNLGLIEQAKLDLNIDLTKSWMIGDTTTDILTSKRAGLKSILVNTGYAGRDNKWPCIPDFECATFVQAADLIIRRWPVLRARAVELVKSVETGAIILVGGLARSGKSTWAASFVAALKENGRPSVVVPLDSWLRGENDRKGSAVLDRYDLAAMHIFLADARLVPGTKLIPRYDRVERRSISNGVEINVPEGAIFIVEGVPALADRVLRGMAAKRVYVERSEIDRVQEMAENYRWRGWNETRIAALFAERNAEEVPFIENTKVFADVVLKESNLQV
jgi:histidinol-phosphate phosphatase family protein